MKKNTMKTSVSPLIKLAVLSPIILPLLTACQTNPLTTPSNTGSGSSNIVINQPVNETQQRQTLDSIQRFNADFYREINTASNDKNQFYSPFSLYTAMGMLYQGSNGQTANEIAKVLHADNANVLAQVSQQLMTDINQPNSDYTLKSANGLWVQKNYPIKPTYQNTLANNYLAQVTNLDFIGQPRQATNIINNYIANQTNQKIQDLLSPDAIHADTRVILTNAVYFKSDWATPFNKRMTQLNDFTLTDGSKVKVPMMRQTSFFRYGENADMQIVTLPYRGDKLAMTIILPKASLANIEKFLSADTLKAWHSLQSNAEVNLLLPSFKLETSYGLNDTFRNLGMPTAFSNQADFSGITTQKRLAVSDIIHKAFIEVDETGTEAAAATGIVVSVTSAIIDPIPPKTFRADHPFIFMIEDTRNGNVLFMGKVMNPKQ